MSDAPLSRDDWHEIWSKVPAYPDGLPDDMVRALAQLAIDLRAAPAMLVDGLEKDDWLLVNMPLSLLSAMMRRLGEYAAEESKRRYPS